MNAAAVSRRLGKHFDRSEPIFFTRTSGFGARKDHRNPGTVIVEHFVEHRPGAQPEDRKKKIRDALTRYRDVLAVDYEVEWDHDVGDPRLVVRGKP